MPREIVERPKRGFPVPAHAWLAGPLAGWAKERLAPGGPLDEWVDTRATWARRSTPRARAPARPRDRVWTLIVLREWLERWT